MRRDLAFALVTLAIGGFALGQVNPSSVQPLAASAPDTSSAVYYSGPGVIAPDLIAPIWSPSPHSLRHCNELDGMATLSSVVDANGVPSHITTLQSDDPRLSNLATALLAAQRFKPGAYNGAPVPVAISATLGMQTCVQLQKDTESGMEGAALRSHPSVAITVLAHPSKVEGSLAATALQASTKATEPEVYRVSGGIAPPVLLKSVTAKYTNEARKARITGICVVSLVIDANGIPQNPKVIKSLDPGLDEKALEAIRKYRFKPAMKGNQPVPVLVNVEVNFRLY